LSSRRMGLLAVGHCLALALVGCAGAPSTLDPRGTPAARAADLWWQMFVVSMVVYGGVLALLFAALLLRRAPAGEAHEPLLRRGMHAVLGSNGLVVLGGIALPALVSVWLLVADVRTLAALTSPGPASLTVDVIGHQFWWEVRYAGEGFTTANDIHVPTGQVVQIRLSSTDVIHSFWVPQLAGKLDLIPGRTNTTWIEADTPGDYRGECAEYCGVQHARMAFVVVAEPAEQFAAWMANERQAAVAAVDPALARGAQVFALAGCINCHAIRYGAGATGAHAAPDLTHVGSRRTLAAGTLDNNLGNMAGWIGNPQALKPGNAMPAIALDGPDLVSLATYLESLK
jgi:cytochrome c oxidase subunit II